MRSEVDHMLRGRDTECERLDRLLAGVKRRESGVLVLRGEAGVGKTALLDHLAMRSAGCGLARAAGVESEMELPFSGLQQLCAPFLARIDRLPGPQADALGSAFGLVGGKPQDRFLVGLAVLSLLADVAEERPLVCLVDDAQWLDRASAQALAFVARRLVADAVALVFAVRAPDDNPDLAGLDELSVQGLSDRDGALLLASVIAGPLDERVRRRILAETRGNPLALLELPRGLTPAELAGGFGFPATVPLASRIEDGFLRRLLPLPDQTRHLLVAAAAEPLGDARLLWRAAERLGIPTEAATAGTEAGLIEIGSTVRFRHPLLRSAVYRAAGATERRAVHSALAMATDPDLDPDRRAWHHAQAASGPDEEVAAALERSAGRAQARGGVAAAAAFLERASELTPDPAARGGRALAAAQAKFDAAAPERALELLAIAEGCPLDALQRARLERLRAQLAFARSQGASALRSLLDAARGLEPLDAPLARETYLEALGAGIFAGRLGDGAAVREVAEAARGAPPGPVPSRPVDLLLDGLAVRFTDGFAPAVPALRRASHAFAVEEGLRDEDLRWLWLAWSVAYEVWDDEEWHALSMRLLAFARESGALAVLPIALIYAAQVRIHEGHFPEALALHEEVRVLNEATGRTPLMFTSTASSAPLVLVALQGREALTSELVDARIRDATERGEGRAISVAEYARAVLHNGLGRYDAALRAAQRASEHEDFGLHGWVLAELIEASARTGSADVGAAALPRLQERTRASGTDWAIGIELRSRALLTDGADADALYREAIERLGRTRMRVALARVHLLYGEWLRRQRRRIDARDQLRTAHDMFLQIGMDAFAERTRRELLATGEKVRRRTVEARIELTAQEAQIGRLAAAGRTNPEIGAQLFISPRTVEWHLRKLYVKLDISSRRELQGVLPAADLGAAVV